MSNIKFDPVSFTVKAPASGVLGRLVTSHVEPAAVIELKDGAVTLSSREYLRYEAVSQVIAEGVKKGDQLEVAVTIGERALLTVSVNGRETAVQLNWPSYRGETIRFIQERKESAFPPKIVEPAPEQASE